MELELIALLSMGFTFGLLHALDADHVMAVSSMSSSREKFQSRAKSTFAFCARWALGHGGVLCVLAAALLAFELQLPAWLNTGAEKLVGVILIALGFWILWSFKQNKVRLRIHAHGDHVHAHLADETHSSKAVSEHGPVFVGITHGLAGSAPVLALLPTLELANSTWGFVYVLLFSLGVLCMMMIFGLGFGYVQTRLIRFSSRLFEWSRVLVASISIGFGAYWLAG